MKPFKNFSGLVAPLDRSNVDTDQIIPKQFLKAVVRSGLGRGLFFDWRFLPDGKDNPEFVLNRPEYKGAEILVARANFGSGSSREHAVWALQDYGFRAVIAPSFADIFHNNCLKNGLVTIILNPADVDAIFEAVAKHRGYRLSIDLEKQKVADDSGWSAQFEVSAHAKRFLLQGLDDVALTLEHEKAIATYEREHPVPY
ncbi:MAG TPA: 3-isopropylmalate dehydratase small subunit [Candidatus Binataceae bacterium]|nr:3-isopropylmalate dehydratase small subunit [Candidatus Binataceae bacterium]